MEKGKKQTEATWREIVNQVALAFLRGASTIEEAAKFAHCTFDQTENAVIQLNRESIAKTGKPCLVAEDCCVEAYRPKGVTSEKSDAHNMKAVQ